MPESTYAEFMKKGEVMNKSLIANASEVPHLEGYQSRFETVLTRVNVLLVQQADLTASKQEISKQLGTLVAEGRQMLSFLSVAVKQHFGKKTEKILAFGLQPLRSRPRVKLVGPDGQPLKRQTAQDGPLSQPSDQ
jgi:hypothetical protein